MFRVKPETIELLFNAQKPELRGRLRLDGSSRGYLADPTKPLDMRRAAEAIGERVLRLLKNCAADAALLGEKDKHPGFLPNVVPPAPDAVGRSASCPRPTRLRRLCSTAWRIPSASTGKVENLNRRSALWRAISSSGCVRNRPLDPHSGWK